MFSKKSVVVGWACSYLVILIIPIIAVLINYHFNVRVIEKEIVQANELVLENLQECMDGLLEDEVTFYEYVFSNEVVNDMIGQKEMDYLFYYGASDAISELSSYIRYNPGMFCYIYFLEKNYILDNKGGARSDMFYDSIECSDRRGGVEFEEWKQVMTEYYVREVIVTNIISRSTSEKCLIYADTIEHHSGQSINVFVGIPISKIEGLVQEEGYKVIISIDGCDMLLVQSAENLLLENLEYISDREVVCEGEKYVCLEKTSSFAPNISFKLLINDKEFWQEAQYTRNLLLIIITIVMVTGVVCVFLFLKLNARPLTAFLKRIGGAKGSGNEYMQMERIYQELTEKNVLMHNKILNQEEVIEKNKLLTYLKGRYISDANESGLFALKENEQLSLVAFKVPLPDQKMVLHDELLYFIIDNVFRELMKANKLHKIEDGQNIFYLFVVKDEEKEVWKSECVKKMDFLCEFINEKCGVSLLAAVSGIYAQKVEEVRFLYRDIMEALEYQEMIGKNCVVDTSELLSEQADIDFMAAFELGLQKNTLEEMQEIIEQALADMKGHPKHEWQMRGLEVFLCVAQNVYEYQPESQNVSELFSYLNKLLVATDKKTIHQVLDEIIAHAYITYHKDEEISQNKVVDSVKKYVEENYADSSLNIKEMANNLGWTPKHISRVFREKEEMGILEYINNLRIDKALRLMRGRNYSIEEISEKVGYASTKTFRRAFVEKTGMMPSKYKKED